MIETMHFSNWNEIVSYSHEGPDPQVLLEKGKIKLVVVGLHAGQAIPAHAESLGIYHFLAGEGRMTVDQDQFDVRPGTTIIAPKGVERGICADSDLAFLGTRITPCHKEGEEHCEESCDHD